MRIHPSTRLLIRQYTLKPTSILSGCFVLAKTSQSVRRGSSVQGVLSGGIARPPGSHARLSVNLFIGPFSSSVCSQASHPINIHPLERQYARPGLRPSDCPFTSPSDHTPALQNKITSVCYYHLRRLKQVRRNLGPEIDACVGLRYQLDYCNSVLAGLPEASIMPPQRVQNAAARLVKLLGPRNHISSTIRDLHSLLVKHRITYQL